MASTLPTNETILRENRRLKEENAQLKHDIDQLEAILRWKQKQPFESSSERYLGKPLFDDLAKPERADDTVEDVIIKGHKRRKKKRPTIPPALPRETRHYDLPDSEKFCAAHGTPLERNGETTTTQVEYIPAKVKVIDHVCAKYCCPVCDKNVKEAEPPKSPIPGSIATSSLLAQIATAKFADGLPLYRQEGILARAGIELSRTTMASWMGKTAEILRPLYNLMDDAVLIGPAVYIDETVLQVLAVPGKSPTSKSYLWVRVGGLPGHEIIHFHFDPSRSADVPKALLAGYTGTVVSDDYGGYKWLDFVEGIIHLQCWMHIRRYFRRALKALGDAGKGGIADQAMARIRELYMLERDCAEMSATERTDFRQKHIGPLLEKFHRWLLLAKDDVPPKSKTGTAIEHTLKVWDQLVGFLANGQVRPDNSPAENAIRPVAVGRKAWLFCQTVEGAEATAIIYTIIESGKAHGLDPFTYLSAAIEGLTNAQSLADVEKFLPWNFASK